jgi:urea transport system permease protein
MIGFARHGLKLLPAALARQFCFWAVAVAVMAPAARADEKRDVLIQALTTNDVQVQISLVEKLTDAHDPVIAQTLTAWRQGTVYLFNAPDDKLIPFVLDPTIDAAGKARGLQVSNGEPIKDPAGQPMLFLASDLTAADTSAKLRKAIKTTLDLLALSDPNPNIRRDAAAKLGLIQSPDYLPFFQTRLTNETVSVVRDSLRDGIAMIQLASTNFDTQLAGLRQLDERRSIPALDLITKLEAAAKTKPEAFAPNMAMLADKARLDIERHIAFGNFIATCFHGLSLSAVFLIAALGLSITFGLMGIINMAHGEIIMIGAYSAYISQNVFVHWFGQGTRGFDWYFVAAIPFSFLTAAMLGILLERCVIRYLYKRPLESLLATWGVSLVLQQAMRAIFGAANVQVYSPSWLSGNIDISDISITYNRIFVIGFAIATVIFTWLLLNKTSLGLQVRALMQNRQMAACMGIRTSRVNMATFAFGSGLAGMAGCCLSQIGNIGPGLGQSHIVDCFMVVVVGGVGNLQGTVCAALGIGVTDEVLQPHFGAVLGKIIVLTAIILFLQWRPAGLFATRGRGLEG